jgi:hypothetical protein
VGLHKYLCLLKVNCIDFFNQNDNILHMTNLISMAVSVIIALEGCPDKGHADFGLAHGALGIHKRIIDDVNRIAGTHFTTKHVHNRSVAVFVCKKALKYYGSKLDKKPTIEDYIRIWNAGYDGYKDNKGWSYVKRAHEKNLLPLPSYLVSTKNRTRANIVID